MLFLPTLLPCYFQLQLNKTSGTSPAVTSNVGQSLLPQPSATQAQHNAATQAQQNKDYVPIASSDPVVTNITMQRNTAPVNGYVPYYVPIASSDDQYYHTEEHSPCQWVCTILCAYSQQ